MPPYPSAGQPNLNARNAERQSTAVHSAENRASNTPARSAGSRDRKMGDVAVILKIMPESPEVDLAKLQADIKAKVAGIQDIKIEPIGFGLSAVKVAMVTSDDAGAEDKIIGKFAGIAGIESTEIESLTLL